ncbi:MAG TPA: hypothetical protein VG538_13520 [Vicinamibacterales bacterium]|jgi:hypothetical protein|nr:hypothetical protein [Vicinamibacterales bacterium]
MARTWRGLVTAVVAVSCLVTTPTPTRAQATTPTATSPVPGAPTAHPTVDADGTVHLADGSTRQVDQTPAAETASPAASTSPDGMAPDAPPSWLKDPATNAAFLSAMRAYYAYRETGLTQRQRVFAWQLVSSKIIFVVVLLLVGAGIVFAAIQFGVGLRRTAADAHEEATSIDLSTTSVKVSSPVLGVIILFIALAFFYLYLVYVYPISEIF